MNRKYSYLLPLLFSVIMVFGIIIGFRLREVVGGKRQIGATVDGSYDRIEEVMSLVQAKYVDTVNQTQLADNTISEMLSKLDPHSTFISAKDLKSVNESLDGNFDGIGIEFFMNKDTITVLSPISGGPSEALGIKPGDKIVKINDTIVAGVKITNSEVMRKLRGEKGTKVKVGILRLGSTDLMDFTITRDQIPLYSVDAGYMVDKEVGYIKINRFASTTYEEFMKELKSLKKQGMTKLMIDLRQNPGGLLDMSIMIADELIGGRQLLLYTQGKSEKRKDYSAKADGDFESGDLVLLIDEGSASASEILSGAVQDYDRGLLVGRRSFGKGLVQEQFPLSDGSAVRLTVARYYTPSGRCIQKPYGDNLEDYYAETDKRFTDGELEGKDTVAFPDSLKFKTLHSRIVYGGGGITPDIFVPIDTAHWKYLSEVRTYIPQFVYSYYFDHQKDFEAYTGNNYFRENFEVTKPLYDAFLDYAEKSGLKRDEAQLAVLDGEIKTTIKADFARQLWKNNGYYSVINTIDPVFEKGYEAIKDPKSVNLLYQKDKAITGRR